MTVTGCDDRLGEWSPPATHIWFSGSLMKYGTREISI